MAGRKTNADQTTLITEIIKRAAITWVEEWSIESQTWALSVKRAFLNQISRYVDKTEWALSRKVRA